MNTRDDVDAGVLCARHLHSRDHVKSSCLWCARMHFFCFLINELNEWKRRKKKKINYRMLKGGINFHSFMDVAIDRFLWVRRGR